LTVRFSKIASERGSEFAARSFTAYSVQILSFLRASQRKDDGEDAVKLIEMNKKVESTNPAEQTVEKDQSVEQTVEKDQSNDEESTVNSVGVYTFGGKRAILNSYKDSTDEECDDNDNNTIDEDYDGDEPKAKKIKTVTIMAWNRFIPNLYTFDAHKNIAADEVFDTINRTLKDLRRRQIKDHAELCEVMKHIFGNRCVIMRKRGNGRSEAVSYRLTHKGIDE